MSVLPVSENFAQVNSASKTQAVNSISKSLGKDDFLKLLTTELKNQDPLQAQDNKQFIAELAQLSSVELINNVADELQDLKNNLMLLSQQSLLLEGAALIGKKVTGIVAPDQVVEGIIEGVKFKDGKIKLQVGQQELNLTDITTITS